MRIDAEARAALEELAALWMRQQAEYPHDFGGAEAAAAVRCCSKELAGALSRMEVEPEPSPVVNANPWAVFCPRCDAAPNAGCREGAALLRGVHRERAKEAARLAAIGARERETS